MPVIKLPDGRLRRIAVSPSHTPPDEFEQRYSERCRTGTPERKGMVFYSLEDFRRFLRTAKGHSFSTHNTCTDSHGTLCVHYSNEEGHHAAALYGYRSDY